MARDTWHNITLIGLGSQGQAWAQNLRESGREVSIFLREGSHSLEIAQNLGLKCEQNLGHLLKDSHILLLLIPDHSHLQFLADHRDDIPKDTSIIYAHGASFVEHHLDEMFPQWNHILLAPKAIASELRSSYKEGHGLGAVFSIEAICDSSQKEVFKHRVLNLAKDLGITAGPFEVTFEQETRADLLSEQSLLCGLLPYAAKNCYDIMIDNGIPKELAYLESWHEVKLIANAMIQLGPTDFFKLISPHALVGARLASKELFDKGYQETIEKLREDIWNGSFFQKVNSLSMEKEREDQINNWQESSLQKTFENIKDSLSSNPQK